MSFISQALDEGTTGISRREMTDEIFGEIRRCEKEFSNLLSCYDAPKLRDLMQTLQQLENIDCISDVCSQPGFSQLTKDGQLDAIAKAARQSFEKIFITLFDRGALDRLLAVSEVTDEAEAEVVRMRQDVHDYDPEQSERQQQVAAEPEPIVVDPIQECVDAFHNTGSAAFKAKYISNTANRHIYETCVSRGLV